MGEWSKEHGSAATKKKIFLGTGRKYFDKIKVGEFIMETHSLKVGDEVVITGPKIGVIKTKVEEIRVNDTPVNEVHKGTVFSIKVPEKIYPADKLYKWVDAIQEKQVSLEA